MQKKLPIGISTLEKIVEKNLVYVDKTKFVASLVQNGEYYFLSRPRRFGKSLLIDTFKQAFLGKKKLFQGLYLENNWDWSKTHPIIQISFSGGNYASDGELDARINGMLNNCASSYDIVLKEDDTHGGKLGELITKLHEATGNKVVVLIDEYDKPILDAIDNTKLAIKNRSILKGLYGILKDRDNDLRFVFVTGVTKFAKAGIFSDLNNLNDITLSKEYADICGYTQNDIETTFKDYLKDVDLVKLKNWYNGYNFLGTETQKVYNPYDILLFIQNGKKYKNYWFGTGIPTFLIKLLQKNSYYLPNIEGLQITETALESFDIDNLSVEVLLLQSGYLTIRGTTTSSLNQEVELYILDYPNFEVRTSLNDKILNSLFGQNVQALLSNTTRMEDALQNNNYDQVKIILSSLLASIPHDWYRQDKIQHYEGHYCSVIYSFFNAMGLTLIPEDRTNLGQIDLTIILRDKILIIEFKMLNNNNAENALKQIKDKKYYEKYLDQNKPIYLIGMVFDGKTKNICEYAWELLTLLITTS